MLCGALSRRKKDHTGEASAAATEGPSGASWGMGEDAPEEVEDDEGGEGRNSTPLDESDVHEKDRAPACSTRMHALTHEASEQQQRCR